MVCLFYCCFSLVSLESGSEYLESVLARPDHVVGRAYRIVDFKELTALEAESFWHLFETACILVAEVWILLVLGEISDQELASVA